MGYPVNTQRSADMVDLNPDLQSRLLNGCTNLEQALDRLDALSGVGQSVAVNLVAAEPTTVAGVWSRFMAAVYYAAYCYNQSNNNGDAIDVPFCLGSAGTWGLSVQALGNNVSGIIKMFIDGTQVGLVGGYDLYNAWPNVDPLGMLEIPLDPLTAGAHTLRIAVDGKRAASGGFQAYVQQITFRRVA